MISLSNINVSFKSKKQDKVFSASRNQVIFDVSMDIKEGKCLGILGESGSGKSTLGKVICGLLKPDSGEVLINNQSVYKSVAAKKELQKNISVVFQDYTTSVNPRFMVKGIIEEGLNVYCKREKVSMDKNKEIDNLLKRVGLSQEYINRFPHELSGGQLQRVCIARALACRPQGILFDEAISSLDAHTQVQIMDLLKDIKDELNLTYIFITHDLTSVTYICDQVLFLYKGKVVERIDVENLSEVKNEYARNLLDAILDF